MNQEVLQSTKTIIGIIGTIGSGKDAGAEYISNKLEIPVFQISQPLKDIAKERNIELTRQNLVELGTKIADEEGPEYLAKVLLGKISETGGIITGMRQLAQIEYLRKNSNLILLAVDANPEVRFKRSVDRNKQGEAKTLEEFISNEQFENSGYHIQRLFECLKLSDCSISNNFDLESFHKQLDAFLEKYKLV